MWKNRKSRACFLLISVLKITSAQNSACGSSPCPQANGLFPVPNDCTAFYNCAHCTAYKQQCGPGTAFDPLLHICNHLHMVDCSGTAAAASSYSQNINERKPSGVSGEEAAQRSQAANEDAVGSKTSLTHRSGAAQPSSENGYGSTTKPYPYQENHRFYDHDSTGAHLPQAPSRNIHQAGQPNAETGYERPAVLFDNQNNHRFYDQDSTGAHYPQLPVRSVDQFAIPNAGTGYESTTTPYPHLSDQRFHGHGSTGAHHSQVPARNIYQAAQPDAGTGYESTTTPYPHQNNHRFNSHDRTGEHHSQVPAREIYQPGAKSYPTNSRTADYTNQDQRDDRAVGGDNDHRQHASPKQHEPSLNVTEGGTVAVSTRSRFNHSHIAHHPEAVSYLPSHQVVYDHSHGEHHHDGQTHSESHEFSSNNRGTPQLAKNSTEPTPGPTNTHNSTVNEQRGFDLKDRYVANSGFVPSYVRDRMSDETPPKSGNYGEREYVRAPNRKSQDSGIRNIQGQPINPDRFYTDDVGAPDADSQESPVQLNADDLHHFQQNQAAQGGIPYVEASSNTDRQGRNTFFQPGFRSQYSYLAGPPSSAAPSPTNRVQAVQAEQISERSGQLFVEHKRQKRPQDDPNLPSSTSDASGRSESTKSSGGFEESESREHIVYVSAPALPTPLPLMADRKEKEYHHLGYRFDHDPMRERVKSS